MNGKRGVLREVCGWGATLCIACVSLSLHATLLNFESLLDSEVVFRAEGAAATTACALATFASDWWPVLLRDRVTTPVSASSVSLLPESTSVFWLDEPGSVTSRREMGEHAAAPRSARTAKPSVA